MSADILSDVLRAVHLSGGVFFDIRARAPWVAEAPAACEIAPLGMPKADHVIEYHLVVQGTCYAGIAWSLDDLAREVGLSKDCLARSFHRGRGLPPDPVPHRVAHAARRGTPAEFERYDC